MNDLSRAEWHTFRIPARRTERWTCIALGSVFALALFVFMALAQMLGDVQRAPSDLVEEIVRFDAPEIEEIQEEEPPQAEEDADPPPEMDREPPRLTLDQLDIALNPGTGGNAALAGDFSIAGLGSLGNVSQSLDTETFVDFADLDQIPRPIGVAGLNFPRRLRKQKVDGVITLMLKLNEDGEVLDVKVESSNLPRFDAFVLSEVRSWRFTPPTRRGEPVRAQARLPIPIRIS
jgi:protein TonB